MNRNPVLTHLDLMCMWATFDNNNQFVKFVPAQGASVLVFKQGATGTAPAVFGAAGSTAKIYVEHSGSIQNSNVLLYVEPNQSASHGLDVLDILTDSGGLYLLCQAQDGSTGTIGAGTRLLLSTGSILLIYPDPLGVGTPEPYLTVDAYGVARGTSNRRGGYIKEYRYDVWYPGATGEGPRILADQVGGWVMRS